MPASCIMQSLARASVSPVHLASAGEPVGFSRKCCNTHMQAAQQLAEADPAGWGIGRGAWPAGVRDNHRKSARFRRAA
ncbi:MAG: hypothetical protein JXA33_17635 [Anaerolineae bacterium]|nr:hypothetical protein [Anaerolineae bacterium]